MSRFCSTPKHLRSFSDQGQVTDGIKKYLNYYLELNHVDGFGFKDIGEICDITMNHVSDPVFVPLTLKITLKTLNNSATPVVVVFPVNPQTKKR